MPEIKVSEGFMEKMRRIGKPQGMDGATWARKQLEIAAEATLRGSGVTSPAEITRKYLSSCAAIEAVDAIWNALSTHEVRQIMAILQARLEKEGELRTGQNTWVDELLRSTGLDPEDVLTRATNNGRLNQIWKTIGDHGAQIASTNRTVADLELKVDDVMQLIANLGLTIAEFDQGD